MRPGARSARAAPQRAGRARVWSGGRRGRGRRCKRLEPGQVLLLENSRWEEGETENDPELAAALAELADLYVNDAFGAAHRAHATTEGVAHLLPAYAGLLLERELSELTALRDDPERPLVVVLGGAKVSDKIGVLDRFLEIADKVLIGGAMCFSFFRARGVGTGDSLVEEEGVALAEQVLEAAERSDCELRPAYRPRDRRFVLGRRRAQGDRRDRGARRLDGPRHRARDDQALRGGHRRRRLGPLERADGRVRDGAVRRRNPRGRRGRRRRSRRTRSSAAATPRRRSSRSASTRTSTGSRPAAAPRSSSWKARTCRAWSRSQTSETDEKERRMSERRPYLAANWKMQKTVEETEDFLDRFLGDIGDLARHRHRDLPAVHLARRRRRALPAEPGQGRRAEHARGRLGRLHRRDLGPDADLDRGRGRGPRPLRAPRALRRDGRGARAKARDRA